MFALGANLDAAALRLTAAAGILGNLLVGMRRSSLWRSRPSGHLDQPVFHNAAVAGLTDAGLATIAGWIRDIEASLGRRRRFRNGPREIDVDLLLLGDVSVAAPPLDLPHPRLLHRAFALHPAAEVAPDLIHPGVHRTLPELARNLGQPVGLERVSGPDHWSSTSSA